MTPRSDGAGTFAAEATFSAPGWTVHAHAGRDGRWITVTGDAGEAMRLDFASAVELSRLLFASVRFAGARHLRRLYPGTRPHHITAADEAGGTSRLARGLTGDAAHG